MLLHVTNHITFFCTILSIILLIKKDEELKIRNTFLCTKVRTFFLKFHVFLNFTKLLHVTNRITFFRTVTCCKQLNFQISLNFEFNVNAIPGEKEMRDNNNDSDIFFT